MAIKLADTARPNNYVDAEHLGTFPVAYAEDVWFEDGTRLSEKTFDGQSIQKEELPLASADELGNIYQYVGETGTYTNGRFYKCILNSSVYSWSEIKMVENPVVYSETVPDINAYETGSIVCYTGEDSGSFEKGHLYKNSETSFTYYYWTFYRDSAKTQPYIFYTQEETLANGVNVYQANPTTGEGDISLVGSITNYQEFSFFVSGSSSVQYFHPEADTSKNRIITEGDWIDIDEVGGIIDVETLPTSDIKNTFYRTSTEEIYAGNESEQSTERMAVYSDVPDVSKKPNIFIGTQAEWDSLTVDEKAMYTIVNITDDTNTNGKFIDITSQCTVILGTAKVMKCGQIVMVNGSFPKQSTNNLTNIITGLPHVISNGTSNMMVGAGTTSSVSSAVIKTYIEDTTVKVNASTSYTTNYSIIYLTDE